MDMIICPLFYAEAVTEIPVGELNQSFWH